MLWCCVSQPCQTRDSWITRISARSLCRRSVRHDNIRPLGERFNSPMDLLIFYLARKIVRISALALTNELYDSLIYFDDFTKTNTSSVREFHARFVSNRPQLHPVLDYYAELLRNAWNHFSPSCANLVVSSSLDFVTGLILEYDHQKMPVWLWVICIWYRQVLSGFRWTNVPLVIRGGFEPWRVSRHLRWYSCFHLTFRWLHTFRSFPTWSIYLMM